MSTKINDAIIARCVLDNPDLPVEFIRDILTVKNTNKSFAEPFNFNMTGQPKRQLQPE